jgi:hypothetical protein
MFNQGSVQLKKILTVFAMAIVFLLGSLFGIYIDKISFDVTAFLGALFTGIAALATAYAAFSASKSAQIAELSASTWKKQMQLGVELDEAKKLKIALHAWHRHFTHEAERYLEEDLVRIGELIQIQKNNDSSNQIEHLQRYLDKHEELWNNLEQSFDNASFIVSDFEERLRLRRLSYTHSKSCNKLISYFQGNIEPETDFFEINCSAVYRSLDWHKFDLAGLNITRSKLEKKNDSGKLVPIPKDNGDYIYTSVYDDVQSWYRQIGVKIDFQIEAIKRSLGNI